MGRMMSINGLPFSPSSQLWSNVAFFLIPVPSLSNPNMPNVWIIYAFSALYIFSIHFEILRINALPMNYFVAYVH